MAGGCGHSFKWNQAKAYVPNVENERKWEKVEGKITENEMDRDSHLDVLPENESSGKRSATGAATSGVRKRQKSQDVASAKLRALNLESRDNLQDVINSYFKQQLPKGWKFAYDEAEGKTFYYHPRKRLMQFEKPIPD